MPEGRRHRDQQGSERRRREDDLRDYADQLEELLEHGSRNFRRYRRRAFWAFAALAVANAVAIYLVIHNSSTQRAALARETQQRAAVLARAAYTAKVQAHAACVRSRIIGPPLTRAFEVHHLVPPRIVAYYRASIPDHC